MENKFYFTTLLLMALAEDISDCDRHQKDLIANITQEITFGTQRRRRRRTFINLYRPESCLLSMGALSNKAQKPH